MQFLKQKLIELNIYNNKSKELMFNNYYNLLVESNKTINLTTIVDKNEVEVKHFIDSISAYKFLNGEILDIGAGAGFPSIPLAIISEDFKFTLVESVGKKAKFLIKLVEYLKIKNVKIKNCRIENLEFFKYDTVVARAVAPLNTLIEYSLPFLKLGGILIAYKGANYKEELNSADNALKILGGELEKIEKYNLEIDGQVQERALVIIKKILETDNKYPRSGNKPRLKPL